jgi:hypothetical protein
MSEITPEIAEQKYTDYCERKGFDYHDFELHLVYNVMAQEDIDKYGEYNSHKYFAELSPEEQEKIGNDYRNIPIEERIHFGQIPVFN